MKVYKELIVDANDKTVASVSTIYRTEEEVEAYVALFLTAPSMKSALEAIARKVPHKVSREEAADMACEFHALAVRTLQKMNAKGAQDASDLDGPEDAA